MALQVEETVRERMNYAPADLNPEKDLPKGFLELLLPLHKHFTPRQQKLVAKRAEVLRASHRGRIPITCHFRKRPRRTGGLSCRIGAPTSATR